MIGSCGPQRIDHQFQSLNPGKIGLQRLGRLASVHGAGTGEESSVAANDELDLARAAVLDSDSRPKLDPATGEVQFPHRFCVGADPDFGGFTCD